MPKMKNRKELRQKLFEARGGRCEECSTELQLETDRWWLLANMHESPNRKLGGTIRPYKLPEEAGPTDGVVHLLCFKCHDIITSERPGNEEMIKKYTSRDHLANKPYIPG